MLAKVFGATTLIALTVCATVAGAADRAKADAPKELTLTIEGNRFAPEELRVPAGAPFVIVLTNKDKGAEEFESKDLRIEKVVPGGKTLRLRMPALKPGTYSFVGEYHESTAKGRIVAE